MKRLFPSAPAQLPGEMPELLRRLADLWAQDPGRPRPSPTVVEHWDSLIARWADDSSLPLLVRKPANNRGAVLVNGAGRKIIPADNSPAQWAFALAVLGETPSLAWVNEQLSADAIPIAMILQGNRAREGSISVHVESMPEPQRRWLESRSHRQRWSGVINGPRTDARSAAPRTLRSPNVTREHVRRPQRIRGPR